MPNEPTVQTMRVVFMGTPQFAQPVLAALDDADFIDVSLVVTRPDAVSGRGKQALPSPVKQTAVTRGIDVYETKTLRDQTSVETVRACAPDVICVAAYGAILTREVLDIPRLGCINVHASLLPQGRGAAPMQRDLLSGSLELGCSIMKMEEGLDTGPYCKQVRVTVDELATYEEASLEVARQGASALVECLRALSLGESLEWCDQDDSLATHADKISKAETLPNPSLSAFENACRVRASSDAAPARCTIGGRGVRLVRARVWDKRDPSVPKGTVVKVQDALLLGCEDAALEVTEVKPDGKRLMRARDFANGLALQAYVWEGV